VPLVKPVTVMLVHGVGVFEHVPVMLPGLEVTV
jgi:hypothetical protein